MKNFMVWFIMSILVIPTMGTAGVKKTSTKTHFFAAIKTFYPTKVVLFKIPVDLKKGVDCFYKGANENETFVISILKSEWGGGNGQRMYFSTGDQGGEGTWQNIGRLSNLQIESHSKVLAGYVYFVSKELLNNPSAYFQADDDFLQGNPKTAIIPTFLKPTGSFAKDEENLGKATKAARNELICVRDFWAW